MPTGNTIETTDLTKSYGRRVGVEGLSLSVPAGTIYGFLGPNGSGKTTTIRVLMGLLRPSGGRAAVLGRDSWAATARIKRDVGYLPGDVRLYAWMTCRNGLRIASAVRRKDWTASGLALAERFDLDPDVPVRQMSRGMRQKLGLVLALAHRPQLLILDEPTASLDPIMQSRLYDHLRECTARGRTVFLSSHTLSEVEQLADRVAILRRGRLAAEESIANLRGRARRAVSVVWKAGTDTAGIRPPDALQLADRTDRRWTGSLDGPAGAFLQWCAAQPIEDLSIGDPDLGAIFRSYYA